MNEKVIYIADDEVNIRNLIKGFLEKEGYKVIDFPDGDSLYERIKNDVPDLVILDVMMPGRDGFMITEAIRQISKVPIILLTARDTDTDLFFGITLGSDDYITKPFSPMTLTMKVRALFRRIEMENVQTAAEVIEFEDITILPDRKMVKVSGKETEMAPNEYALLKYLIENQDRAVSRNELLDKVWGFSAPVETRVTDDTLKRLRRKITESKVVIETVWGFGFRLKKKE